jgi:Concanavalin A-like lectin/glucanases superfamily
MSIVIEGGIDIGPGINIGNEITPTLMLNLDGAGYGGSGPWVDTVSAKSFTLYGSPTYSPSIGGGSFDFDPGSSQYAECSSNLSSLTTWTVIAWHFYTGANTGAAPCIITEVFPSGTNQINYSLGSNLGGSGAYLMSGFFNGAWRSTPSGYSLPSNGWYQIVGTYNGTANKLYVNNTLVQSASYTGTPAASTAGIRLMRRWDDANYWAGRLAIAQVYDGAMSASQIAANWNANKARFGL